jgi:hypothetical protein
MPSTYRASVVYLRENRYKTSCLKSPLVVADLRHEIVCGHSTERSTHRQFYTQIQQCPKFYGERRKLVQNLIQSLQISLDRHIS